MFPTARIRGGVCSSWRLAVEAQRMTWLRFGWLGKRLIEAGVDVCWFVSALE